MATKRLARRLGLARSSARARRGAREAAGQSFAFLIVLDLEATCWAQPGRASPEIIEFPAVLLNTSTGVIESEFHMYVQPQEHPILSKFCTELTGITQNQVDEGVPLHICLSQFLKWIQKLQKEKKIIFVTDSQRNSTSEAKACAFVTWTDWDLAVCLHYECRRKQLRKPDILNCWIDLKATYRDFYNRKPKGLSGALQDLGIAFEGREHFGLDDSRNTARLAWRLICDGCVLKVTKSLEKAHQQSNLISRTLTASCTDRTPVGGESRPGTSRDGTCGTNCVAEHKLSSVPGNWRNAEVQTGEQQVTHPHPSAGVPAVPSSTSGTELPAPAQSSSAASPDRLPAPPGLAQPCPSRASAGMAVSPGQPLGTASPSVPVQGLSLGQPLGTASLAGQGLSTGHPLGTASPSPSVPVQGLSPGQPLGTASPSVPVQGLSLGQPLGTASPSPSVPSQGLSLGQPLGTASHSPTVQGLSPAQPLGTASPSLSAQRLSMGQPLGIASPNLSPTGQGLIPGQSLGTASPSVPAQGSPLVLVSTTIPSVTLSTGDISTSWECLSLLTDWEDVALIPQSQYEQNSHCEQLEGDSSTESLTGFEGKTISKQLAVPSSGNQSLEESVVPTGPLESVVYRSPDTTIYNTGTVQGQTSAFSAFKLHSAQGNDASAPSAFTGNYSTPLVAPKRKPTSPKTCPPAKKQPFHIYQEKTSSFDHSLPSRSSNWPKVPPAVLSCTVNLNQSVRAVRKGKPTPPLCDCGRRAKKLSVSNGGPNHGKGFFCCPVGKQGGNKKGCGYFKWEHAVLKEKSNGLTLNAEALTLLGTVSVNRENCSSEKYLCLRPSMRT